MTFPGYFVLGGNEIINSARTAAYVRDALPNLGFFDCYECEDLPVSVGEEKYRSPMLDPAPWFDESEPESRGFLGVYPLSVEGIDQSVRTATVTESATDGGYIGSVRRGTRTVRVSALLFAVDDASLAEGLIWLRYALSGNPCSSDVDCLGDDLCYLTTCPSICEDAEVDLPTDLENCSFHYSRRLRNVKTTEGPRVTQRFKPSCGAMMQVEFVMVAGVPWQYGFPETVVSSTEILPFPAVVECAQDTPSDPLLDPSCPPVPAPPRPPTVPDDCITNLPYLQRFGYRIPADLVPEWHDSVPVITLKTRSQEVRQVRLRFYQIIQGVAEPIPTIDPCGYCGEFLLSYLPADTSLVIDGSRETALATLPGGQVRNASTLLYGSNGTPFTWPVLTCGTGYMMTIDLTNATTQQAPVDVFLQLAVRA